MRTLFCILCRSSSLLPLVKEMENWQGAGASVFASGLAEKGGAYIMLSWHDQIPERFYHQLRNDGRVIDFFRLAGAEALGKR
jgi:hypothetical protein